MTQLAALIREQIRQPNAQDNKYTRGVVGFVTGSNQYPGAALLGVAAAEAVGLGMVRYFGPQRVSDLLLSSHPQVLTDSTVQSNVNVDSWVLGSGVPQDDQQQAVNIHTALSEPTKAVIDAGAIQLLDYEQLKAQSLILTPHEGELKQLFLRLGVTVEPEEFVEPDARLHLAERASNLVGQTILLKGSISIVAQPGMTPVEVGPNSPHLATAGTGDVLAGLLGALAAISSAKLWQGWAPVAELAILLHSAAAEETAKTGPMVAGRLSEQISKLIRGALA